MSTEQRSSEIQPPDQRLTALFTKVQGLLEDLQRSAELCKEAINRGQLDEASTRWADAVIEAHCIHEALDKKIRPYAGIPDDRTDDDYEPTADELRLFRDLVARVEKGVREEERQLDNREYVRRYPGEAVGRAERAIEELTEPVLAFDRTRQEDDHAAAELAWTTAMRRTDELRGILDTDFAYLLEEMEEAS